MSMGLMLVYEQLLYMSNEINNVGILAYLSYGVLCCPHVYQPLLPTQ
jgi:hypothetical protein